MARMQVNKSAARNLQYAALCYRVNDDGEIRVLLVTSRDSGQWILPKGNPIKGYAPHEAARRELWEEAGVTGRILGKNPVGSFEYDKHTGKEVTHMHITVYRFLCRATSGTFKENGQRAQKWCALPEALYFLSQNTNIPLTGFGNIQLMFWAEARRAELAIKKKARRPKPQKKARPPVLAGG